MCLHIKKQESTRGEEFRQEKAVSGFQFCSSSLLFFLVGLNFESNDELLLSMCFELIWNSFISSYREFGMLISCIYVGLSSGMRNLNF